MERSYSVNGIAGSDGNSMISKKKALVLLSFHKEGTELWNSCLLRQALTLILNVSTPASASSEGLGLQAIVCLT